MIGTMVGDVIAEVGRRVADAGVQSIDDVRSAGRALAGFSAKLAEPERELKRFLYANLYNASALLAVKERAQRVVTELAEAYKAQPMLLPPEWRSDAGEVEQVRRIGDFIAGMTDRFAISRHRETVGPLELPDHF
jgi:dGTPase